MKAGNLIYVIAGPALLLVSVNDSNARKPKWELLGMRKVSYQLERD